MYSGKTVEQASRLSRQGLPDREIAQICGTSTKTITRWRNASHRDLAQARLHCPRCDGVALDEYAYACLLGLYLGDGQLTRGRRDVYALCVACGDAWPGLIDSAAEAMTAVMPISRVGRVQRVGYTEVKAYSKHWPCLFPQHGPGRKHTRKIELAGWQQDIVTRFPGRFARGLFHSDGYRGVNRVRRPVAGGDRWYEYPRYFFSNESGDIMGLCRQALDQLGVDWRMARPNSLSVARDAVARLDEHVGEVLTATGPVAGAG